jgi:hypothetical protein
MIIQALPNHRQPDRPPLPPLHLSMGNDKIGGCPNLSLPPGVTCHPTAPCRSACYAAAIARRYPSARAAWADNLALYTADPAAYFATLARWMDTARPEYFRLHVGGDYPDALYRDSVRVLMTGPLHKDPVWDWYGPPAGFSLLDTVRREGQDRQDTTRLLAFTKRADLLRWDRAPLWYQEVFSLWPEDGIPDRYLEEFRQVRPWALLDTDSRLAHFPHAARHACPGRCVPCGRKCWHADPGTCIVFHLHR